MRTRIALVAGLVLALSTVAPVAGKDNTENLVFTTRGAATAQVPGMFKGFDPLLCTKGSTELVAGGGWPTDTGYAFDATIRVTCSDGTGTFDYRLVGDGPPTAFDWWIVVGTEDYTALVGSGTGYNSRSYNMGYEGGRARLLPRWGRAHALTS